jgi:hypothetical protein
MNWRRGLLRLWMAASLIWVVALGWFAYEETHARATREAANSVCMEGKKAEGRNPFDCFDGQPAAPIFEDLIPTEWWLRRYAALAVLPPLGLLAVSLLITWILAGFKGGKS